MPRPKTNFKSALAEAYERELKKLTTPEESIEEESDTTDELDFDSVAYNDIPTEDDFYG